MTDPTGNALMARIKELEELANANKFILLNQAIMFTALAVLVPQPLSNIMTEQAEKTLKAVMDIDK